MISKAYIHEYGNGKLEPEHAQVCEVLKSRGVEYELFTSKKLHRNQLMLDNETLVIGDHPTIRSVFKRINYSSNLNTYPICLRPFLFRHVQETTIGQLLNRINSSELSAIFIKPKSHSKLFTGFIAETNHDILSLANYSKTTQLFISEVVEWVSEYRVFVCNSEIVGIKHYKGDHQGELNRELIQNAVEIIENSDERTNGYALDFGILTTGETSLIEWNDGFALGSYDLDKELYTNVIIARWEEILRNRIDLD